MAGGKKHLPHIEELNMHTKFSRKNWSE